MRSLLLLGSVCWIASCATAQRPAVTPPATTADDIATATAELYFINGREASRAEVQQLARERIARIEIIKGSAAAERCGMRGQHGVIDITTVDAVTPASTGRPDPLYLIDGRTSTLEQLRCLSVDSIKHIEIIKGETAAVRYGAEAQGGVIVVTTKRPR